MAFWNRKKKARYRYDTYDPYGDVLGPFTRQSSSTPVQISDAPEPVCDSSSTSSESYTSSYDSGDSYSGDSSGGCE